MSASQQQNPYTEIEARRVNEWRSALVANPELLEGLPEAPGAPPDAGQPPRRAILTWDEIPDVLSLPAQKIEWALDEIIPKASITLIAGEPGSYKSWLALCLLRGVVGGENYVSINTDSRNTDSRNTDAHSVVGINTHARSAVTINTATRAGTFLGRPCAPMDALYLDRENPLSVVRERMAMLGINSLGVNSRHASSSADTCLPAGTPPVGVPSIQHHESRHEARYWGGWLPDPAPCIGDIRLLEAARKRQPLMIFDSLIRFHAADENSATEMAAAMQDLRALANAGATVVLLHHRAKSETSRYRGSSDIAGGVDLAISVSRDRAAGIIKLDCFKSRFSEEFSMTLRPELRERGDFAIVDTRESAAASEIDPGPPIAELIWEAIRTKQGQTKSELLASSGLPKGRLYATLDEFEGKLWRSERAINNARQFFPMDRAVQPELDIEN